MSIVYFNLYLVFCWSQYYSFYLFLDSFSLWQILTSTALKKGGLSTGDVAAKYKYRNLLIDVKVDTESKVSIFFFLNIRFFYVKFILNLVLKSIVSWASYADFLLWQVLTTLTFTEIIPSTKTIASVKYPDFDSGKVKFLTTSLARNRIHPYNW